MKILNLGCGGHRPQGEEWWNLDTLREFLKPGTPERSNLDMEPRYIEHRLGSEELPFPRDTFDGILCQHVLEHMDCHTAAVVVEDCYCRLKPGGVFLVSVPDVDYFMKVHPEDNRENAEDLFGEPISEPWHSSFFSYALFHNEHIQLLNWNGLCALLVRGGFAPGNIVQCQRAFYATEFQTMVEKCPAVQLLYPEMNRRQFSAIAFAFKPL